MTPVARMLSKEEIFELAVEDRLRLIGRLWESIASQDLPLSQADARLIDERLAEHRRDPDEGIPLDEFLGELSPKR